MSSDQDIKKYCVSQVNDWSLHITPDIEEMLVFLVDHPEEIKIYAKLVEKSFLNMPITDKKAVSDCQNVVMNLNFLAQSYKKKTIEIKRWHYEFTQQRIQN